MHSNCSLFSNFYCQLIIIFHYLFLLPLPVLIAISLFSRVVLNENFLFLTLKHFPPRMKFCIALPQILSTFKCNRNMTKSVEYGGKLFAETDQNLPFPNHLNDIFHTNDYKMTVFSVSDDNMLSDYINRLCC